MRSLRWRVVVDATGITVHHLIVNWSYRWGEIRTVEVGTGRAMTSTVAPRLTMLDGTTRVLQSLAQYATPRGREAVVAKAADIEHLRAGFNRP